MNQDSLFNPPPADPSTTPDLEQRVASLHRLIEDQGRQLHEELEALSRPAVEAVRAEQQRAGKIALDPDDVEIAARLAVQSADVVNAARFLTSLSEDYGWTDAEPLRVELLERLADMPELSWSTLRKVLRACNGEDETLEYDLQELVAPLLAAAARERMPGIAQLSWVREYGWDANDRDILATLLDASIKDEAIGAGMMEMGMGCEDARSDLLFWLRTAGPIVHPDAEERVTWFLNEVVPAADSGGYIVGDLIEGLTEIVLDWTYEVQGDGEPEERASRILRVIGKIRSTESWSSVLDADRVREALADLKDKARRLMDEGEGEGEE